MGHSVTRETVPAVTTGIITLRLADTAEGRTVDLTVDSMTITKADGRPVPDAGWRAGSATLTRVARAFREPITMTSAYSVVVARIH